MYLDHDFPNVEIWLFFKEQVKLSQPKMYRMLARHEQECLNAQELAKLKSGKTYSAFNQDWRSKKKIKIVCRKCGKTVAKIERSNWNS